MKCNVSKAFKDLRIFSPRFWTVLRELRILGTEATSDLPPQIVYTPAQQALRVNTAQQGTLFLYDIAGNLIEEKTILNPESTISCAGLAKGVYLYRFVSRSGTPAAGKILVGAE